MTPTLPGRSLRSQAAQLRAIASELEAQADAFDRNERQSAAEALGLPQLGAEYGFSRESLKSASEHGLPVHKGPRGRLTCFRADVDAWIRSRAWTPTARKIERSEDDALAQAEAELLALGGFNTRSPKPFSAESSNADENSGAPLQGKRALRSVGSRA